MTCKPAKLYGKLKYAFKFKNFLNESSKLNLIETYILSLFNYGDIILQKFTQQLQNKIKKSQSRYVCFTFNI